MIPKFNVGDIIYNPHGLKYKHGNYKSTYEILNVIKLKESNILGSNYKYDLRIIQNNKFINNVSDYMIDYYETLFDNYDTEV